MDAECCICGEHFNASTEQIVIIKHYNDNTLDVSRKRGHYFHKSCLNQWKQTQLPNPATCPLDRDIISRVYTVPTYQMVGFDIGAYNFDFKDVIFNIKITNRLLEQFIDIDEIDKNNRTLAFYACKIGNYTLVKKLLQRGADFNKACGPEAFTPLMVAICYNHTKLISKLLSSKKVCEGLKASDVKGMTAFSYACEYSYNTIITEFLVRDLVTPHEVRYNLDIYRTKYNQDKLYGLEIIDKLCFYLAKS
jgi:hypothetical protein